MHTQTLDSYVRSLFSGGHVYSTWTDVHVNVLGVCKDPAVVVEVGRMLCE